jgi:hypothetical protein
VTVCTIAAISDLHLGAPGSYFNEPTVTARLLQALFPGSTEHLDLLVLVGDVIDLSNGRGTDPWIAAKRFFLALDPYHERIGKILYLPGNHDHHVWVLLTEYQELLSKFDHLPETSVAAGAAQPMLGTVYPYWTPMHRLFPENLQKKVVFKYPFHSFVLPGQNIRFVFHHGHFFDPFVAPLAKMAADRFRDPAKIEAFNLPYLESLFYFCRWDSVVQDAELGFYQELTKLRLSPPLRWFQRRWRSLRRPRPNLGKCDSGRIETIMKDVGFHLPPTVSQDLWIFGHTHCGDHQFTKRKVRQFFNLGGWILNHAPAVDQETSWSEPRVFRFSQGKSELMRLPLTEDQEAGILARYTTPSQ